MRTKDFDLIFNSFWDLKSSKMYWPEPRPAGSDRMLFLFANTRVTPQKDLKVSMLYMAGPSCLEKLSAFQDTGVPFMHRRYSVEFSKPETTEKSINNYHLFAN